MESCCCTNGFLSRMTAAVCPVRIPQMGEAPEGNPLGHRMVVPSTPLKHRPDRCQAPFPCCLSWQGEVHLPLQKLQMRMAKLGGDEANPDVSSFSLAAAQLRRRCHKHPLLHPLLLVVMLRQGSAVVAAQGLHVTLWTAAEVMLAGVLSSAALTDKSKGHCCSVWLSNGKEADPGVFLQSEVP